MEIQVCNNNKAWDYRGAENRDFCRILDHFLNMRAEDMKKS